MKKALNLILISLLLLSCNEGANKKLLKESIYIYEIKNDSYQQLSDKEYSLDSKTSDSQSINNLIGNIKIDSIKPIQSLKVKPTINKMLYSNILIDDGFIYFIDSKNNLHKRSLNSINESFKLKLDNDDSSFSTLKKRISLNNGIIIASIGSNRIYQIDTKSFKLSWSKDISNIIRSSNVIDDKNIYISTIDNVVFAINRNNGKIKWKSELDAKQTSIYGSGFLSDLGHNLIFTSSLGETVSLNKANGNILWSDKTNLTNIHNSEYDMFDSELKPIIEEKRYYNWTYAGSIICYNSASGIRKWTLNIRPITNLWLNGDIIYTVSEDQNIIAIDKNNGKIIWYKSLDEFRKINSKDFQEQTISSIFVTNNKLAILSKSGKLIFLDPIEGYYLSNERFGKNIISLPYSYSDKLYFQDHNGNIRIYH